MPADRIKGITIEISGNTTKLQDSLSDVNKSLKDTKAQLKDVDKLLKMDPGNTELLAQKQRLLGQAVTDTKSKLDTLKEAQKQMNQLDSFTPEQQREYDNLQREIIETESDLKNLEKQTAENKKAMSGFTKAGNAIKSVGEKAGDLGNKLMPATAAVTGLAAAAGAAWAEVDDATDKLITMTGAGGDALADLERQMKRVATTVPTSFDKAADAVGEVSTRFGLAGEELGDLSAQFIRFATINNTDVIGSIDAIQRSMAAFNVPTERAVDVMDMLTTASQNTGVSIDTLLSGLETNQTLFQELGLSLEDSIGFLAVIETTGAQSSEVLAGLKKAMQNAAKEGTPLRDKLGEIETAMMNAGSEAEGMQIAIDTFGAKAGPAIYKAVKDGKLNLSDFSSYLSGWEGSTTKTFEDTQDAPDKLTTILNNLKIAGSELATMVLEELSPYISGLAESVEKAVTWFSGLDDSTKKMILTALGLVAVAGPLLKIFQGISTVLGLIVTHPIIALIAGVIAGLVYLYNTCEPFRDLINGIWNGILVPLGTWITNTLLVGLGNLVNFLQVTLPAAIAIAAAWFDDTFGPAISDVKAGLDGLIGWINGDFSLDWDTAWKAITAAFGTIWNEIKEIAKTPINAVIGFLNDMINAIKNGLNFIIDGINDAFSFTVGPIDLPFFGEVLGETNISLANIPHVPWHDSPIPLLWQGGVMTGGSAVVGDAGPELLTMQGSRAYVAPLPGSAGYDNSEVLDAMASINDAITALSSSMARMQVVMDSGALVGSIAAPMDNALAMRTIYRQRRV